MRRTTEEFLKPTGKFSDQFAQQRCTCSPTAQATLHVQQPQPKMPCTCNPSGLHEQQPQPKSVARATRAGCTCSTPQVARAVARATSTAGKKPQNALLSQHFQAGVYTPIRTRLVSCRKRLWPSTITLTWRKGKWKKAYFQDFPALPKKVEFSCFCYAILCTTNSNNF